MTIMPNIKQFHGTFQIPDSAKDIRPALLEEEHTEVQEVLSELKHMLDHEFDDSPLHDELYQAEREALAKELADLVVVAAGTAKVYGIDLDMAFEAVMASNMSKLDPDGKPIFNEDGKVLKGPNYREPDMSDCLDV